MKDIHLQNVIAFIFKHLDDLEEMIPKELSEYVATFKALKTVQECMGGKEFCQHSAKEI